MNTTILIILLSYNVVNIMRSRINLTYYLGFEILTYQQKHTSVNIDILMDKNLENNFTYQMLDRLEKLKNLFDYNLRYTFDKNPDNNLYYIHYYINSTTINYDYIYAITSTFTYNDDKTFMETINKPINIKWMLDNTEFACNNTM